MKVCKKCEIEKDDSAFYLRNPTTGNRRTVCTECENRRLSDSYERRKEVVKLRQKAYYEENKEWYTTQRIAWNKKNPAKARAKFCESAAKRKARKLSQSPELSKEEKDYVDYLYWLAKDLKAVSGQDYHVDHIVALANGGPHHPNNLQVLPADLNMKKGARKW